MSTKDDHLKVPPGVWILLVTALIVIGAKYALAMTGEGPTWDDLRAKSPAHEMLIDWFEACKETKPNLLHDACLADTLSYAESENLGEQGSEAWGDIVKKHVKDMKR